MEWDQVDVTGVVTGNVHSEDLYRQSVASLKRNKVGLKGRTIFPFYIRLAEFLRFLRQTITREVLFMMNKSPSARLITQLVEHLTYITTLRGCFEIKISLTRTPTSAFLCF